MKKKKTNASIQMEQSNNDKDEQTMIFTFLAVFLIFFAIVGLITVKGVYSVSGPHVTFYGDTGWNFDDNSHYNAPPGGECAIDSKGYLDANCAYLIACVCREWSKTKAGYVEGCPGSCQTTVLWNSDIFVTTFTNGDKFYCVSGTSYSSTCDISAPVTSCYECTVSGGKAHVKTINPTRAASYTGGSNCQKVSDSVCNPTPTPTQAPTPTPTVAPTPTQAPTPTPTVAPTPTPTQAPTPTPTVAPTPTPTQAPTPTPTVAPTPTPTASPTPSISCYECTLGVGYEYVYATSKNGAARYTGGTSCSAVPSARCENHENNCYECTTNGNKTVGHYDNVEDARTSNNSDDCTIVNESKCHVTPDVNPKTGINPSMIVIILSGIIAFGCMVRYVMKKI